MQENFYDPDSASSSGASPRSQSTHNYSESKNNAWPPFWIAAWYTEYYGYFRKRFWTTTWSRRTDLYSHQQFQEFGNLFSRIETWYWRKYKRGRRLKWDENRRSRRYLYHASKVEVECWIILVELILTVVWLIIRDFRFRNCIWEHRFCGISKLESQLQDWNVQRQQILIWQCNWSKKLR